MRHACLAVATAVLTCGCNSLLGIEDLQLVDGRPIDTPIDTPAACFGTFVKACLPVAPMAPLMLSGAIDTGTDSRCVVVPQTMGPDICAIAGTEVTIGATTVTGSRPLMVVATTTMTITGRLDAGSKIGANPNIGPGANSTLCAAAVNGGTSTGIAGGGGAAGGSFATAGGGGGAGNGVGAGAVITPNAPQPSPTVLRGGCPGGTGGASAAGGLGGAGGAGGGAVYLVSSGAMTISGVVRASGAAARHGNSPKGGGGAGGSGGMIVLEASAISVTGAGALIANGGGGAEGSLVTGVGNDGQDDRNFDQAPTGGSGGSSDAGNGGDGAFLTTAAENGTNAGGGGGGGAGGGGGGGGLGVIRTKGPLTGTMISPAVMPL